MICTFSDSSDPVFRLDPDMVLKFMLFRFQFPDHRRKSVQEVL